MRKQSLSGIRAEVGRKGGSISSPAKIKAARLNGALGGAVSSDVKAAAARLNGRKGGRPRKQLADAEERRKR